MRLQDESRLTAFPNMLFFGRDSIVKELERGMMLGKWERGKWGSELFSWRYFTVLVLAGVN